jgi:hypothetical protein
MDRSQLVGENRNEADAIAVLARIADADPAADPRESFTSIVRSIDPLADARSDRMKALEAENRHLIKRTLEIERDKIVAEIGVESAQDTIKELARTTRYAILGFVGMSIVAVVAVCVASGRLAP